MTFTKLEDEQRSEFETNGFIVIPGGKESALDLWAKAQGL